METQNTVPAAGESKFCKHCGQNIKEAAVICPHCGCQVKDIREHQAEAAPQIVINNTNSNVNSNVMNAGPGLRMRNKWVAFCLCLFLGFIGAHKFYEGKTGMGILYLFTGGLFFIGVIVDLIALLFKPNPYYV